MISFIPTDEMSNGLYRLYLIILVLIPLNFVTPSKGIGISIFSLAFISFGLLTIGLLVFAVHTEYRVIVIKNVFLIYLFIFLVISVIVTPWSIDIPNSISNLSRLGYHIIATVLLSTFLTTYWEDTVITSIPKASIIMSTLVATTIITDYFSITSFGTLPGHIWNHPDRAAGIIAEPNFAAGILVVSLPFFAYFSAVKNQSRRSQACYLAGMLMTISAIYFTGSRMGILLIMLFVIGACIIHRDEIMKKSYILPVLFTLPIGLYLLTALRSTTTRRFLRLISYLQGGAGDGSIRERLDLLMSGINMLGDKPMTGVGPGNFPIAIQEYLGYDSIKYSHNTYIDVASQTGLIGLCLFFLVLILIFKSLLYIDHDRLSSHYILSYILLLGSMFFLSNLFSTYFWFVFAPVSATIENIERLNKKYRDKRPPKPKER
jgi:O-antigen ligase